MILLVICIIAKVIFQKDPSNPIWWYVVEVDPCNNTQMYEDKEIHEDTNLT